MVPSPDNKWIAFTILHKAYIAPLLLNGKEIDLDNKATLVPVSQIAKDAGINLHWSSDSKTIHWTLGDSYFTNAIKDRYTFLPGSPEKVGKMDSVGITVGVKAKMDKPKGKIAFVNARIITMEGGAVIEDGTIVVSGNRIESIGKSADITVADDAKIYDMAGKTIMPGMVDAHAHVGGFRYGLTTQKHWPLFANLAYGVTTAHDPSANTESIFAISEMIKSGEMIGPQVVFYRNHFIWSGWRF